jgi:hypothetical protein
LVLPFGQPSASLAQKISLKHKNKFATYKVYTYFCKVIEKQPPQFKTKNHALHYTTKYNINASSVAS